MNNQLMMYKYTIIKSLTNILINGWRLTIPRPGINQNDIIILINIDIALSICACTRESINSSDEA